MIGETYDDVIEIDDEALFDDYDDDDDEDQEDYDAEEVDEMLDALVDASEDEDLAERRRRGRKRRRRGRRRGVKTARRRTAYRPPTSGRYVTQKQFKAALTRVGSDVGRNAKGIKTVNSRVNGINGRVDGVVSVNRVQSREIGKLSKQMKIDGALELVESLNTVDGQTILDPYQLLKGAVKSGVLGEAKGALASPWAIGGIGFVLRNTNLLGALQRTPDPA